MMTVKRTLFSRTTAFVTAFLLAFMTVLFFPSDSVVNAAGDKYWKDIENMTTSVSATLDGNPITDGNITLKDGSKISFNFVWTLKDGHLEDTVYYVDLAEEFSGFVFPEMERVDGNGCWYWIENNKLYFQPYTKQEGTDMTGAYTFYGDVDLDSANVDSEKNGHFTILDQDYTIPVQSAPDLNVSKSAQGSVVKGADGKYYQHFIITVENTGSESATDLRICDYKHPEDDYRNDSVFSGNVSNVKATLTDKNGRQTNISADGFTVSDELDGSGLVIGELPVGSKVTIEYDAEVTTEGIEEYMKNEYYSDTYSKTNYVYAECSEEETGNASANAAMPGLPSISKRGSYNANTNKIVWTITVNTANGFVEGWSIKELGTINSDDSAPDWVKQMFESGISQSELDALIASGTDGIYENNGWYSITFELDPPEEDVLYGDNKVSNTVEWNDIPDLPVDKKATGNADYNKGVGFGGTEKTHSEKNGKLTYRVSIPVPKDFDDTQKPVKLTITDSSNIDLDAENHAYIDMNTIKVLLADSKDAVTGTDITESGSVICNGKDFTFELDLKANGIDIEGKYIIVTYELKDAEYKPVPLTNSVRAELELADGVKISGTANDTITADYSIVKGHHKDYDPYNDRAAIVEEYTDARYPEVWYIQISARDGVDLSKAGELVITDTLPNGMELIEDSVRAVNGAWADGEDISYCVDVASDGKSFTMTLTDPGDYIYNNSNLITIKYVLRLTEERYLEGGGFQAINTASADIDGEYVGESKASYYVSWEPGRLRKTNDPNDNIAVKMFSRDGTYMGTAFYTKFAIDINPGAVTLNDGEKFDLVDVLGSRLDLLTSDVISYGDGETADPAQKSIAITVGANKGITVTENGEELTGLDVTYENKTITIKNMKDKTPYHIEYWVRYAPTGLTDADNSEYSNNVSLVGHGSIGKIEGVDSFISNFQIDASYYSEVATARAKIKINKTWKLQSGSVTKIPDEISVKITPYTHYSTDTDPAGVKGETMTYTLEKPRFPYIDEDGNDKWELIITDENGDEVLFDTSYTRKDAANYKWVTYRVEEIEIDGFVSRGSDIMIEFGQELNGYYQVDEDGYVVVPEKIFDVNITNEDTSTFKTIIVSKQDLNGEEIDGAVITVTKLDENEKETSTKYTWTSGRKSDGTPDRDENNKPKPHKLVLEEGTYLFHEESAPNGYVTVSDIIFSVDENGNVTVEKIKVNDKFEDISDANNKVGENGKYAEADNSGDISRLTITDDSVKDIKLIKEFSVPDGETVADNVLKLVEFGLYKDQACTDTNKIASGKLDTDPTGAIVKTDGKYTVTFDSEELGLEAGKDYYLKETSDLTAYGYNSNNTVFKCSINDEGKVSYSIVGTASSTLDSASGDFPVCTNIKPETAPTTINITVTKSWNDGNNYYNARPDEIKVNLLQNGTAYASHTLTAAENWTYTFTDLPISDGTTDYIYTVEEDIESLQKTWTLGYSQAPEGVTGSAAAGFIITNEYVKEETPEQPKHIVKIKKVDITDDSELPGAWLVVKDSTGKTVVGPWESTTEPQSFELEPGTYTIEETTAPDGFDKITTAITFKVDGDGNVTVLKHDNAELKDGVILVKDAPTKTPAIPDEETPKPESKEIVLIKTYEDDLSKMDEAARNKLLYDTKFRLTGNGLSSNGIEAGPVWEDGKAVVRFKADLSAGSIYVLSESQAPKGYVKSTNEYFCRVRTDGKVEYKLSTEPDDAYSTDFPKVMNLIKRYTVKISKKAVLESGDVSSEELEGATLTLTGSDGTNETWQSGEKPHEFELKPGDYTIHETTAPDGFETVTDISFTVDEDGTIKLSGVNTTGESELGEDGKTIIVKDSRTAEEPTAPEAPVVPEVPAAPQDPTGPGDWTPVTPIYPAVKEDISAGAGVDEKTAEENNAAAAIVTFALITAAAAAGKVMKRKAK